MIVTCNFQAKLMTIIAHNVTIIIILVRLTTLIMISQGKFTKLRGSSLKTNNEDLKTIPCQALI